MKNNTKWWLAFPLAGVTGGLLYFFLAKKKSAPELATAAYVDLNRYLGTWYDIAHLPASFQKGCHNTQAEYSLNTDGTMKVVNTCNLDSLQGEQDKAEGVATVVDKKTNAKLKVEFLWPFKGDYWILAIGDQYDYALVGEPGRKYLWILSRSPRLDEDVMDHLIAIANEQGFATNNLIMTKHKLMD